MIHHRSPKRCDVATIDAPTLSPPTTLKRNGTGAADDFGLPNTFRSRAMLIWHVRRRASDVRGLRAGWFERQRSQSSSQS
jgi:hypothetical protein